MTALPPPVPGPTSLLSLLSDTTNEHANHLTQAHAARAQLRSVLKQAIKSGPQADWAQAHKATADYLPLLYGILTCVEADALVLSSEPTFTWRTALSTKGIKSSGANKVTLPSLHFELTATLLSHALCLSNHAATLVTSLGTYEALASTSTSALAQHDATLNTAAEMFCRASGVLQFLAETVVPRWEAAVGVEALKGRPVEFGREVISALSGLFLATANLLAIRRLLSRSIALQHTTQTPGPPLPPSHPSPSLLAKLNLNVHTLFDSARALCKSASASNSASSSGEVSPDLRRVLSDSRALALARSYKWLGIDAGENGKREKAGEAVGWLTMAKSELEETIKKGEGLNKLKLGKGKKVGKQGRDTLERELESVKVFLHAYNKVNNTVHFQPVPSQAQLLLMVPAGRAALTAKPFAPPAPAFKPRQAGDPAGGIPASPGVAGFDKLTMADDSDDDEPAGDYFGQGMYY